MGDIRNVRTVVFLDTLTLADQLAAADAEPGVEPDRSALIRKLLREREALTRAVARIRAAADGSKREAEHHHEPMRVERCDGQEHGLRAALRMLEEEGVTLPGAPGVVTAKGRRR